MIDKACGARIERAFAEAVEHAVNQVAVGGRLLA